MVKNKVCNGLQKMGGRAPRAYTSEHLCFRYNGLISL